MPAKPNPLERCEPPRGERSSRYDPPGSSSLGASLYPGLGTFTYRLTLFLSLPLAASHRETHLRHPQGEVLAFQAIRSSYRQYEWPKQYEWRL